MKSILQIMLALAVAVVLTHQAGAVPITGTIGFSGTAVVDTGDANTASKVVAWGTNTVGTATGTFANFGGGIPLGTQVNLTGPFNFYGTLANPLLQIDGFTFNPWSCAVFAQGFGYAKLFLQGNMSGNGYVSTSFAGWLQLTDPSTQGAPITASLSLSQSVPDAGATVVFLGGALSGLMVIRRKLRV